jgi:23S rRNA (uracil1939-C5)-methyltransferase
VNRSLDVTIDSIAAGGDGVGRVEGLVVFVPRSAPGDVGRVRIERSGRFARASWQSIERAGPARVEPPCEHYVADRCGGCQLQHLSYPAQLAAKGDIIRDAIQRIAKRDTPRPSVRPSPIEWRYRRKLTLALRRRSTDDQWIAGLHPYDNPGRVFDLRDCPITDERVLDVWREIRAASRWLPQETELRGAVRVPAEGQSGETSFVLEGGARWETHARFAEAVPSIRRLWWQPRNQPRRQLALAGAAPVTVDAQLGAGTADASFVQVNAAVAAELHQYVVAMTLAKHPESVVDAYAGSGDTAVALAEAGVRVTAIELDRAAAAVGERRLRAPSRMLQARVENALVGVLPADIVILNPPRLGLDERVPVALAEASPRALIYVSCNPATLARDIGRLPGYRIASVVAFDMFPQTAHVETVCELVSESA